MKILLALPFGGGTGQGRVICKKCAIVSCFLSLPTALALVENWELEQSPAI